MSKRFFKPGFFRCNSEKKGFIENIQSKIGIEGKIAALVLFVVIITLIPISLINIMRYSSQKEMEYNDLKKRLTASIGITFVEPVWNYDLNSMNQLILSEMMNENIFSIRIYYKEKNLMWLSRTDRGNIVSTEKIEKVNYLDQFEIPLIRSINNEKKETFAAVSVWMDKRIKAREILILIFNRSVENFIIILIVIVTIIIAVFIKLAKPLESIIQSVRNVSANLQNGIFKNYKINNNRYAFKEMRFLGMELNVMMNELEKSSESLKKMNEILEEKVKDRTKELELSYENLKKTQNQLIFSEKMAILGQLVAGIAHESNTPLGSIISSNNMNDRNLKLLFDIVILYSKLKNDDKGIFQLLISRLFLNDNIFENLGNREFKKKLINHLDLLGVDKPEMNTEMLIDIGFKEVDGELLKIIEYKDFQSILKSVHPISSIYRSTKIINIAADKASKIVAALKTYSHYDQSEKKSLVNIADTIEISLTLCINKIKTGIEVIKDYEKIPEIECYSDKIIQVWMNIINNAIYAMDYKGKLEIRIRNLKEYILVSFTDNGKGIPEDVKDKIFLPFFTTKSTGEGTGLGLDICKRIIDQINGKIEFESITGKTVFSVYLPYAA